MLRPFCLGAGLPYKPELKPGLEARVEKTIPHEWTIAHFNPALPPVLSTPAMIGMMEWAASQAIQPALPDGHISVGTRIEVDHLKAVSTGALLVATARLTAINGRFFEFEVEARSGEHLIGRGRVFRAVVDPSRHKEKAESRTEGK